MKVCPRCASTYPDDTRFCVSDATPLRKLVDPMIGKTIAQRYRLISRLGAGGMSSVYLARHVLIDRLSAIKILRPDLAKNPSFRDRFLREARAVNRINHDNVVEISDFGEAGGFVYLVMEYVPGESLEKVLAAGPIPWKRFVPIALQVAAALGRAHQVGVVHRDLKPDNILLVRHKDGSESAKLTDFGIAKILDAPSITASEHVFGTAGYISPEYLEGGRVDARSDLYALGVVCYEALTGRMPHDYENDSDALVKTMTVDAIPVRARDPSLPEALGRTIDQLLRRAPDDRPRDAFVVHDELLACLEAAEGRGPARFELVAAPPPETTRAPGSRHVPKTARDPDAAGDGPDTALPSTEDAPLDARPFSEIGPACRAAWASVAAAVERYQSLATGTYFVVSEAKRLVSAVEATEHALAADRAKLDALEHQARELRARFGGELDDLGRQQSRELARREQIVLKLDAVSGGSSSHAQTIGGFSDSLAWGREALREELSRSTAAVQALVQRREAVRGRFQTEDDAISLEIDAARAALEGHVAALRRVGAEAHRALAEAAEGLGVPLAKPG